MIPISALSDSETKEFTTLVINFVNVWNEKNAERFGDLFTDDAEFTDIVGQIARGRREILDQHEFPFQVVNKDAMLSVQEMYMRPIAPNNVLVSARWTLENSQTPDGKTLPPRLGAMQINYRRESQKWKISLVFNMSISEVPEGIEDTSLRFFQR